MHIEFVSDIYLLPETVRMQFPLRDFLDVLEKARIRLCSRYAPDGG